MTETELSFGAEAPVLHVMSTMRAMRRLKPDPVPRELLEELITAATYAPSGGNEQTFSFVVVTDRAQIARLAPAWREVVSWYVSTQTPPEHMNDRKWTGHLAALKYQADHFDEVPALVVACYDMSGPVKRMMRTLDKQRAGMRALGPRRALIAARNVLKMLRTGEAASIYPAVQNLLLMARARGLGACLTTWHPLFEPELRAILGIPRSVRVYALIPVGYPAGRFGPVSRRPAAELIRWDRW